MNTTVCNRVFERQEGELDVRYTVPEDYRKFKTITKNISGGGVRMTLLEKVELGTILDMEISKKNTDLKTKCKGKVVWIWDNPMDKENEEHFEAGIQFTDAELVQVGKIVNYLEKQNRLFDTVLA